MKGNANPPGIVCMVCRVHEVPLQGRRVCDDCDRLLHKWNRKLYSSTPVIKGREYISRKR